MAKKSQAKSAPQQPRGGRGRRRGAASAAAVSSPVEELLLAALERSDDTLQTGRYIVTFKEGAASEGIQSLGAQGMRVADTRDFENQAARLEAMGDAQAVHFPEIGAALLGSEAAEATKEQIAGAETAAESPIESIDPEYVVFGDIGYGYGEGPAESYSQAGEAEGDLLRIVARVLEAISRERYGMRQPELEVGEEAAVLGATWGLRACRVPQSTRSGTGIRVAVLDTGMDLNHPDFTGRVAGKSEFVGQPVQDLHGHGTHCIGTACGPKAPPGSTPRYGVGHRTSIFVGKVLLNSGGSVGGSVLNGMNWAIANRCQIISMSLSGPGGPHPAYTAAGQAALNNGLLMIAAAGNAASPAGAPANSPTIMSVASLDENLRPSSFSNFGKIEIAGPGRDVFSSYTRVKSRYKILSGTSMAAPHVAGCAALWAESASSLRGMNLWNRLRASAKPLPFTPSRVGAGLVQAP